MKLYFAYGSNMGHQQMRARCPQSHRLGLAQLPGWRRIIAADGYANVIPSATDVVHGVLFKLDAADEAVLDLFEDVATGAYAKRELPVYLEGAMGLALVYIGPLTEEGAVLPEYALRLQSAFADAGLGADYIWSALHRCIEPSGSPS